MKYPQYDIQDYTHGSSHKKGQNHLHEANVLQSQPLYPLSHALQIFTNTAREGWGAHLGGLTAKGTGSGPESKLHINCLELRVVVFLPQKEFQDFCSSKIVLIVTDNSTVVAYINKEGGMRSDPICALLWRILVWCFRKQVTPCPTLSEPAECGDYV